MILSLIIGAIFVIVGIFLNAYEGSVTLQIQTRQLSFDAEVLGKSSIICGIILPVAIFLGQIIMLAVSNT